MSVLGSLLRRRALRRLSKALGSDLTPDAYLKDLLSSDPSPRDEALESLLNLSETDGALAAVRARHAVTRSDLREIYGDLLTAGAGQWIMGVFVPVATLGTAETLEFVLTQRSLLNWQEVAILLLEYFEREESGPVPLQRRGPASPDDPLMSLVERDRRTRDGE